MRKNRLTSCCAAWIACLAILFAALAPSISHAMSSARGDVWTEICSVGSVKLVKIDGATLQKSDPGTQKPMSHCPFCASHGDASVLPPGMSDTLLPLIAHETYPALFLQSPHPLAIWATAQSRAPPSSLS
jgi:hypothetical protein